MSKLPSIINHFSEMILTIPFNNLLIVCLLPIQLTLKGLYKCLSILRNQQKVYTRVQVVKKVPFKSGSYCADWRETKDKRLGPGMRKGMWRPHVHKKSRTPPKIDGICRKHGFARTVCIVLLWYLWMHCARSRVAVTSFVYINDDVRHSFFMQACLKKKTILSWP